VNYLYECLNSVGWIQNIRILLSTKEVNENSNYLSIILSLLPVSIYSVVLQL
jgi:hypothetical protein